MWIHVGGSKFDSRHGTEVPQIRLIEVTRQYDGCFFVVVVVLLLFLGKERNVIDNLRNLSGSFLGFAAIFGVLGQMGRHENQVSIRGNVTEQGEKGHSVGSLSHTTNLWCSVIVLVIVVLIVLGRAVGGTRRSIQ